MQVKCRHNHWRSLEHQHGMQDVQFRYIPVPGTVEHIKLACGCSLQVHYLQDSEREMVFTAVPFQE